MLRGICEILDNLQLSGSFHAKAGLVVKPRVFSFLAFPSLGKNNLQVEWLACSGKDLRDKVAFMHCVLVLGLNRVINVSTL